VKGQCRPGRHGGSSPAIDGGRTGPRRPRSARGRCAATAAGRTDARGEITNLTSTPGISEEHPDWSPAHARAAEAAQARRGSPVAGSQPGGAHEVSFAGDGRPQVYFYRLEWEGLKAGGKFTLGR